MIVEIACPRCAMKFYLDSASFVDRIQLACPNCELEFPSNEFGNLKTALREFEKAKRNEVQLEQLGTNFGSFRLQTVTDLSSVKLEPIE